MVSLSALVEGQNPRSIDLILTYTTAFLCSIVVLVAMTWLQPSIPWTWTQLIIAFLLTSDLIGGVISNLTHSTNSYYQKSTQASILFLLAHGIQPLVMVGFFDMSWNCFWFLYVYMLVSCGVVRWCLGANGLTSAYSEYQSQVAACFMVLGMVVSSTCGLQSSSNQIMSWFPAVYFVKLIYAFSVNHYHPQQQYSK
ncbi:hypothetical protein C9374_006466 [Naegleria lovaniensis]|uniref:Uncharacterized protein n=1 Tax=Naegleria lovaniensis TaxID=51637 RepID=A0AA88GN86_NAELO|nr:uncharacterized protein C9374_006466 [Naegleria lovaniensis]KAG2381477.1 hypothetical protein C9374_006466 [Naegleria lovaniensis]